MTLALALLLVSAAQAPPSSAQAPAPSSPTAPSSSGTRAHISLSLVGFDDGDVAALKERLGAEAGGCGASGVVFVELPSLCNDACFKGAAADAGLPLLSIEAVRFGGDVDVDERRLEGDGVVGAHRTVPSDAFIADLISPEACAVIERARPKPAPATTTTGPAAPAAAPIDLAAVHPGHWVAGGGAVVAVVGLAVFTFAASTVEDPTSSGEAKEGATVQGWVGLSMLAVGLAAAGAGAAWAVVDAAPAAETTVTPATPGAATSAR